MMDREHEFGLKSQPLDLAKRGAELESIFSSIVNHIPDLTLPASFRFAGEDDFFNKTKDLKIVPARKRRFIDNKLLDKDEQRKSDRAKAAKSSGYDKLFSNKPSPNYPFANPMPECMLTEHNIDNLRDIIVSSSDIEWKMLTPLRPTSDYEEKYFDKLLTLHRLRYKSRLEAGYFREHQVAPFKCTRHSYLLHFIKPKSHPSALSLSTRLKSRFKVRGDRSRSIGRLKINVPKVTLTSEDRANEQIFASDDEDQSIEDSREFSYENFSRFSRHNIHLGYNSLRNHRESDGNKPRELHNDSRSSSNSHRPRSASSRNSTHRAASPLEVEEVMSQLMDAKL